MKQARRFIAIVLITGVVSNISCNKDKGQPPSPPQPSTNLRPIARAGADTTIKLAACGDAINIELDGSASSDPDGTTLLYFWRKIRGPIGPTIRNPSSAKTRVENLFAGEYAFELDLTDVGGFSGRDTVVIMVQHGAPKEYDLDITFSGNYIFTENYKDCYYDDCTYYDQASLQGEGNFPPLGNLRLYSSEYTDTAASSYVGTSYVTIYVGNMNSKAVYGSSLISLKKLVQQGRGPFDGSFTINGGSAKMCDSSMFNNRPILNVTGSLDTVTKKVTLRVSGKTFF